MADLGPIIWLLLKSSDVIHYTLQQLTLLANIVRSASQPITVPHPLLVRVVKMKGKPLVF